MYRVVVVVLLVCSTASAGQIRNRSRNEGGDNCKPERKTYSQEQMQILKSMQDEWQTNTNSLTLTDKQNVWFATINGGSSRPLPSPSTYGGGGNNRSTIAEIRMPEVWPTGVRKEYRQMSGVERDRFHRALQAMKRTYPDPLDRTTSEYDIFVKKQRWMEAPAAHFGAAFLPWHREFLWRFETALQAHDPMVSLPYWDSTLDQTLPNPADSAIWTASYLGNNDGTVRSGPFAFWGVIPSCQKICSTLKRNTLVGNCCPWPRGSSAPIGAIPRAASALKSQSYYDERTRYPKTNYATACPPQTPCDYLFSDADIAHVLLKNKYSSIVANSDAKFENDHDLVHAFVGGHMRSIDCAPSDPVYWLTAAFVDCVWEKFRQESQTPQDKRQTEYPRLHIGGSRHQAHAPMRPFWPLHNVHGLSDHYTNYYYECAPRPINCIDDRQCESDLLWCDRAVGRCRAKVRQDGICTGLPDVACAGPCEWGLTPRCLARAEINGQRCVCAYPNTRRPVFK